MTVKFKIQDKFHVQIQRLEPTQLYSIFNSAKPQCNIQSSHHLNGYTFGFHPQTLK